MMTGTPPTVGVQYTSAQGDRFEVIGFGTRGVVVERNDGSAELIDAQTWQQLQMQVAASLEESNLA